VQREAGGIQRLREVAVARGAAYGDGVAGDRDLLRQALERDDLVGVGDVAERVARAEHP
jgi:hypothetical protein